MTDNRMTAACGSKSQLSRGRKGRRRLRSARNLLVWIGLLGLGFSAAAADRVALLIGNSQYEEAVKTADAVYLPKLDSPAADLVLMEKTLIAAGFVCQTRPDRTTTQMRTDVQQFAAQNKGAPVVLFYYSGHGLAQDGVNYLAGIDAKIDVSEKLGDLERARASGALSSDMLANALADIKRRKAQEQLMPLEDVLAALSGMSTKRGDRKIVLLDACRDPFANSERENTLLAMKGSGIIGKGSGGLTEPVERPGMYIGFAAAAGQSAIAFPNMLGKAEPSLFTRTFCAEALKPGVQLRDVFESAAAVVYDESQQLINRYLREQRLAGTSAARLPLLKPQTPAAYSIVFPPGFSFLSEKEAVPVAQAPQMARLMTPIPVPPAISREPEKSATLLPTMAGSFVNSLGMKFLPVPTTKVLFSIWETRVQDYAAFTTATGRSWEKPPFAQGPTHPAVRVSWSDAVAFCHWLTERERGSSNFPATARYRLPTDDEWSRAVGLEVEYGETPALKDCAVPGYPWGDSWPPPKGAGNYDSSLKTDTFPFTSPVGSFRANRYGLYDLGGNAYEWVSDFYDETHTTHPVRGGSWADGVDGIMSSLRFASKPDVHFKSYGFRCVLELAAP